MNILSQVINGLSVGSIYALIALGYSMVYGIIKLINFAHGDIIMIGAYCIYIYMVMLGFPIYLSVLLTVLSGMLLGMLIERIAYRRLVNRGVARISLLITAIGVSIFLQNFAQLIFSSSSKSLPSLFGTESVKLGSLEIGVTTILSIVVMIVLMLLLNLLVKKTKIGKAMRATSEDAGAARLMGINSRTTISFTFGIGSALAAVGAILYCSMYPLVNPYIGSMLGLKAFVAAVLGGIGSIPGAMLGGLALGVVETLAKAFGFSRVSDAVVFGILIIVLLVKPTGILGKNVGEKV